MNVSQRPHPSRSLVSADSFPIPQQVLTVLEEAWGSHQRARILVPLDARQHLDRFLLCLQHLVHHAQGKPLLVLSSVSALPELTRRWQTTLSTDTQLLSEAFFLCSPLALPLAERTSVCFSTVRALQLQQIQEVDQLAALFEVMVAYDVPSTLSPAWNLV